uniref:(California timema) hypothetical protein n=1 Tax=Timema californicum TaxID=61474 RepID=A0A7R9IX51_TIMCA|nr:unnamed protein product [Timema californicum]
MTASFVPGTVGLPTTEVELAISCRSVVCSPWSVVRKKSMLQYQIIALATESLPAALEQVRSNLVPLCPGDILEHSSLQGKDLMSKSDPMVVTYVRPFGETRWVEYHRTEAIDNTHDPDFASKILIPYRFEEQQPLKFEVYDIDSSSSNLSDHDFLGAATCNLAQIISSGKVQLPLMNSNKVVDSGENASSIIVVAEELAALKDEVHLEFSGHNLDKKNWWWFCKSDPFLVFLKATESGSYTVVHRTEVWEIMSDYGRGYNGLRQVLSATETTRSENATPFRLPPLTPTTTRNISLPPPPPPLPNIIKLMLLASVIKNTLDPKWKKFAIPVRLLCNGDYDRSIKVVCYDWNSNGTEYLIGEFYTNLRELSAGPTTSTVFHCINPEKQRNKSSYENSGQIRLNSIEIRKIFTFMDYIKGGCQIHCSIAIDFTGSNGDPLTPNSLHYISMVPNQYEQAIKSVGEIIQDYDTDKMFPVLGFGARLPPDGRVSHEFFVNMNPTNPYCHGIQGVLEAYKNCIRGIQLFGPTNFAPVINHVARFAASFKDGSSYFILLILTDGVISDMPQTTNALVEASVLPLSVIIVGIGNADFSAMETLDADTIALKSGRKRAARDIVQFVPFNKYMGGNQDPRTARLRLAKEVLAEIPTQFISFMKANNIQPNPPLQTVTLLPPDPELLRT